MQYQNKNNDIDFSAVRQNAQESLQVHSNAIVNMARNIHYSIDPHICEIVSKIQQIKFPIITPEWQSAIRKTMEQFQHIAQSFNSIDWQTIEDILVRYTELLIELELPPLHEIEFYEIKEIVSKNDLNETRTMLVNHMVRVYDEHRIESMLVEWKSLSVASKRIHIFEEVVWAHQNKKYNISIPALIAQFEGLVCDIFEEKRFQENVLKQHLEHIFQTEDMYKIANISKTFWIKVLLDNTDGKDRFLSRHAILHGQDVTYGNYEKSLILIIAMDAILDWLNSVSQDVIEQSKMEAEKSKQAKNTKANRLN